MRAQRTDTIAACATAAGAAAIAVVRVSGEQARSIAERVSGITLKPRHAHLASLNDGMDLIDRGIVVLYLGPHSFTGEDCVEFQIHGGSQTVDWLLEVLYREGARPADPGEFSLRAFLNDKLDLTQAEAIADLIASGSRTAARAALQSLEGRFADRVGELQSALTELRVMVEAWIDFPDDEIRPDDTAAMIARADAIVEQLGRLLREANDGLALNDSISLAIAGRPNAGKSSLFNALAGNDAAIVTEYPGTTRDRLSHRVRLAGFELQVVDTAGIRDTDDPIEREGVKRALAELGRADHVLWVADICDGVDQARADALAVVADVALTLVLNKTDLVDETKLPASTGDVAVFCVSALTGRGIAELVEHLLGLAGRVEDRVGSFSARRRHVAALERGAAALDRARAELGGALEIAAEELRDVQTALSELTGEVTSDDLLGAVFSTFCIGK